MSSSRELFWRHPSGAQIIVALIGAIAVVAGAVISTRASNDSRQPEPQSSTSEATVTTRGRELELVSPDRITVRASSTLKPQQGNSYVPGNTIDGDPYTAWGEGNDGRGIGATIT